MASKKTGKSDREVLVDAGEICEICRLTTEGRLCNLCESALRRVKNKTAS